MKVLFKRDVQGVATAGQVKEVADGYARNYLIPRGLAVAATPAAMKQADAQAASIARRAAEEETEARELKARLEAEPIVVTARGGTQGRLYGSVTTPEIAEAIKAQTGAAVDRRSLELDEPIRQVGTYTVTAKLHRSVSANVRVDVRAEASA